MADSNNEHVYKRKRKKSFLQKQKHFGKKGRYGQGVELSEESYQYFIRIMEVIRASKSSSEDMGMLAENVFEEIAGKESDICSNQMASRVIEDVIPFASDDKLINLSSIFINELRLVITDPYCSHVLQKLIVILTQRILSTDSKKENEKLDQLISSFVRISRFALNNLEDFIFDTYANHVLRTLFACVNGSPVKEDSVDLKVGTEETIPIPHQLEELSADFTEKLASWPQLHDLTLQVLPSGCVQAFLLSIRRSPKLAQKLLKPLINIFKDKLDLDLDSEDNNPFLHVIEAALVAAPPKYFKKIYEIFFQSKLKDLSRAKNCNFAVQKLFLHCPNKEYFESMMAELDGNYNVLLDSGHSGTLLAMAKTCRRLKAKEGEFSKNLFLSLNCEEPPERRVLTTPLIYTLTKFEKYKPDIKINLHGSLIVQEMLQFTKPIRLVTSLLNMDNKALASLLSDPRGCHISDIFCSSPYVGEKNREKLFWKLEKNYASLAASKHGSRTFDAIWVGLSTQQRIMVMDELKSSQSAVVSTVCGRVIASKIRLDLYRTDKESWKQQIGGSSSKSNKSNSKSDKKKKKYRFSAQ